MIICLRTVAVPDRMRRRFLGWIDENRAIREAHGILLELVLESTDRTDEAVVVTAWPSHATFDAWIDTPERDRLTASDVHRAVDYRPLTRYEVVGGYASAALCEQRKEAP
jgi:heme-degrading monooxygenase HmoA